MEWKEGRREGWERMNKKWEGTGVEMNEWEGREEEWRGIYRKEREGRREGREEWRKVERISSYRTEGQL